MLKPTPISLFKSCITIGLERAIFPIYFDEIERKIDVSMLNLDLKNLLISG